MSSDIYAKVDLSKKIRYKRKVEDEVEWGREQTVIDEAHQTDLQSHEDSKWKFREFNNLNNKVECL